MKTLIHPATERGHVNLGWLDSHHSFSFSHWYDPAKIHFGALRVINDDVVAPGGGFGAHPHDNMEIVSIPLSGALTHKDSAGNNGIIQTGDVQIMSAGTGIRHSEYNASGSDPVNFLQIWVYPKQRNIVPQYSQKSFDKAARKNKWQTIVGNGEKDGGVLINQDARLSMIDLEAGNSVPYHNSFKGSGVYFFVLEGSIEIAGNILGRRDGIGVTETAETGVLAREAAEVLAIEVPMISL